MWPPGVKHFKPEEFDSPGTPGSGALNMNARLIKKLDALREAVGFPIIINSAYRTKARNLWLRIKRGLKSVDNSAHLGGLAVDIRVTGSRERFLLKRAAYALGFKRIGHAKTFIHLDLDPTKPQDVEWTY